MDRRSREDTRARILAAARGAFASRGYHGTSIDTIIEIADVARATFYLHFKSKRDVFEAALEELIAVVYQALPAFEPSQEMSSQVLKNIERLLQALLDDVDLARILLMEGLGPDADSREKILRLQERLVRYAEDTLRHGQQLGLVREGDVRVMGACVIGAVKEVLNQYITGLRTRADLSEFPREILLTILTGIAVEQVRSETRAA